MNSATFGMSPRVCLWVRRAVPFLGLSLMVLLVSVPLFSQNMGRILGTVTDQSGAAIVGATVIITDVDRGVTRTLTTNGAGEYVAPDLLPGAKKIRAEFAGFKTVARENIRLEVGQDVRIDFSLQPGAVAETIIVTEAPPMVETTNAELGGTLQNKVIENLPLNGRNFENLLTLRPGVTIYPGGGGWTQSTNGLRPHDNVYMVDGMNADDPWMAQSVMNGGMAAGDAGTILPVDAIDEFKTQQNPRAEYGWKPGSVVNVGIKSGTNSIHGTGYAYGRSDGFDARDYFNTVPKPASPLALEQFGATLGGPIKKDKLFYFLTFEEQRYSVGNPTTHKVPITAAGVSDPGSAGLADSNLLGACQADLAAGTLTALSAQMAGLSPATCLPVSGQPANGFQGLFLANPGPTESFATSITSQNRIDSGLVKVDYHLSEKHAVHGMYFISPGSGILADDPTNQIASQWLTSQYARSQLGSGNWAWTPSSTLVNEFRVGYAHYFQDFQSQDHTQNPANYAFNGSTYHIFTGQTNPFYFGLPRIRVNGFRFQLGLDWPKRVGPDSVLQIVDHVSILRGKHAFMFGGETVQNKSTTNVTARTKGPLVFNSLQDFFAGLPHTNPNAGFLAGNLLRHMRYAGYAAFFQDDWRLAPRLTLNMGLRYELNTVMKEDNNLIGNFVPTSATGLVQVGNGLSSPFNGDHNNFAPRFGLAWDVKGDGKTVVRAGVGVVYEQISLDALNGQGNFLGLRMVPTGAKLFSTGDGVTFTQGTGTITTVASNPISQTAANWKINSAATPLYSQAALCGSGVNNDPPPCNVLGVDRNLRSPYVTTWTLGIQRMLTSNIALDLAYVGNHGTNLLGLGNINQPPLGTGWTPAAKAACLASAPAYNNCASDTAAEAQSATFTASCPAPVGLGAAGGKCFPYLAYVDVFSNQNLSNYNGLQATLTQRTSHGLSFTGGYTFSHAFDQNADNEGNGLHTPIIGSNPGALYASSDYDVRHRFTFTMNYDIPGKKGFGQLLEGWSINSIVTLQSGQVWGPNDQSSDFTGTGESGNGVGSVGEPWVFVGNPADFTPVHGWTDTNAGTGGVPFFPGTSNPACLAKSTAMGPLAKASLTNLGCYAVGKSFMVPPAYGSLGTTGRNIFRDSGFKNLDMSVTKAFKIKERLTAQFRAEAFNVFNHPTFANPYGGPGGAAPDPSTGVGWGFNGATADVQASNSVLGSGGPRAIQLGLKLIF
jgi:Carboxypeptidase regulatory-like domain/TonB dependent receptor